MFSCSIFFNNKITGYQTGVMSGNLQTTVITNEIDRQLSGCLQNQYMNHGDTKTQGNTEISQCFFVNSLSLWFKIR